MNESGTSRPVVPRRPVRPLDLLALVTAAALALVMPVVVKAVTPAEFRTNWVRHEHLKYCAVATLYGWTAVLLVLRLADRPAPRRGRRDAGTVALIAVAATFALLAVKHLAQTFAFLARTAEWDWERLGEHAGFNYLLYNSADACGTAIVGVWLALALGGALRRPTDWLSWAAALLGGLWILLTLVAPLIPYLPIPWLQGPVIS